jgi:hypothetical protein
MLFVSSASGVLTGRAGFPSLGKTDGVPPRQHVMSTSQTPHLRPCRSDGPPADVRDWRRCRLLEAGFPFALASALAADPGVDVHALLQLVDRGCPPQLAARILAPLGASA